MGTGARQAPPAWRPPLPREHGSWVMFFAAYLTGVASALLAPPAAGRPASPLPSPEAVGPSAAAAVAFLVAGLAFFSLRRPLAALLRPEPRLPRRLALPWAVVETVAALGAGMILLAYGRRYMVPLSLAAASLLAVDLLRAARSPRPTLLSEAAGALGLALVAPGAFHAMTGTLPREAMAPALFLALHFLSGVFHIRMKARWVRRPPVTAGERLATSWDNAAYQLSALAAALAASRAGLLPTWGWLALVPAVARGLAGSLAGRRETDFKRLGWREALYTALALATWLAVLSLAPRPAP